jgi:S-DNA-T family DNA segregation ATPase FtsK/SpoIIIE
MPIIFGKKPASNPKSKSKTILPAKGKTASKPAPRQGSGQTARPGKRQEPPPAAPGWWDALSAERKLDVVGVIMAIIGAIILLSLFTANRSLLTGGFIHILAQIFGWGLYILPLALIVFGLWLFFRRIEKLPPLTLERTVGSVLLFVWLLTIMHAIIATPERSTEYALNGDGGGVIGSFFFVALWKLLGIAGGWVALFAWLIIAVTMTFDITVHDLAGFLSPLLARLQTILPRRATPESAASPTNVPATNGFSPLTQTPESVPATKTLPPLGVPVTTTKPSEPVIHWQLPDLKTILDEGDAPAANEEFIQKRARLIEETLASFSAPAQVVEISRGPTVTQFGVEPLFVETRNGRTRVRVSKIASLADDLALALSAQRIRIQAPVPGHSYVGIEVPNEEMTLVAMRDILESEVFQRNRPALRFALGRDVAGHPTVADLSVMPHLLIAGTTGSGKSVCVNSILTSFLLHNTPDDLRLILVDPKRVELTGYNGVPHLLAPVVVEMDRVIGALQWMTREMDKRYHEFARIGARNIADFNARVVAQGGKKLPFYVVVVDELADLMMIAPDETERTITRLAQLSRATGIHLILATQRPSVDVVTGLIKANFPARIAFAVASGVDSRVILDQPGAERLLGRGDMLYQAPDSPAPARLQGVFVSDHEIQGLVEFWRAQVGASPYTMPGGAVDAPLPSGVPLKQGALWEDMTESKDDPLLKDALDIVRNEGKASVSMLQRKLRIGYTRASRLMDTLEEKGIVGPQEGASQLRRVLDMGDAKQTQVYKADEPQGEQKKPGKPPVSYER